MQNSRPIVVCARLRLINGNKNKTKDFVEFHNQILLLTMVLRTNNKFQIIIMGHGDSLSYTSSSLEVRLNMQGARRGKTCKRCQVREN